ncbi:hypothetical protein Mapa_011528 [Marchantia paleacea]|nr:hypothetical protein Mapa_011528 [Marchantia paleacea]
MISTFCGTSLAQPSRSRHSNHWYFSPQCWTTYAFCLLLGLAGCYSAVLQESTSNVTLPTDNSCLLDTVPGGHYRVYTVDFQGCSSEGVDGYLNVELHVTNQTTQYGNFIHDPLFWLVVDTREQLPVLNVSRNGTQTGSTFATIDDDGSIFLNHTRLILSLKDYDEDFPWYASVSAWTVDVSFVLSAWCTGSEDCADKCEEDESKRCVGRGSCKCFISQSNSVCETDVQPLQHFWDELKYVELESSVQQIVGSGEWNYYSFEAFDRNARVLVELVREQGDTALFLKPRNANSSLTVPSGSDFDKYSDKDGFRNRFGSQYIYFSGPGSFVIGVFNNDACVRSQAAYNLAVTVATPHTPWTVCPFNCSYPQGTCIRDAECACEKGYAGYFCDASVEYAELFEAFGDTLQPGEIIYYQISLEDVVGTNSLSIEFTRSGGHAILLVGEAGPYPTPVNNTFKSLDGPSADNISSVYSLDNVGSSNESVVLAVFNADHFVRGESTFEVLVLLVESENAKKALKPTLIILVGFLSSFFACVAMGIVKFLMHRWNGGESIATFDQSTIENVEDTALARQGLERDVVESYPLITYQEELKLNETQCPICLSEYNISDKLRVIPPCTHTFHMGCVDKWLRDHANCPVCRVVLQRSSVQESSHQGGNGT